MLVAGLGVPGGAAVVGAKKLPVGIIASGQIGAGQLVGVGPDGLAYAMFVERAAKAMAKAIQVPWELIDPDSAG